MAKEVKKTKSTAKTAVAKAKPAAAKVAVKKAAKPKVAKEPRAVQVIDAANQTVGRLATKIALALRGKDKPEFMPHLDLGAVVQVVNIEQMKFSGKKIEQKKYFHYSGYPGGLKETKMSDLMQTNPGAVLYRAVRKMIPATRLRNDMLKRLIIK